MEFKETPEFSDELKHLKKKYKTLDADLLVLKKTLSTNPVDTSSKHSHILTHHPASDIYICKVRMMCRYVKGAQFRVTYGYKKETIEILFIELYYKGNKANEDKQRYKEYFEFLKKDST